MTPIIIKWAAIGLLMIAIILPSLGQQTAEDWFYKGVDLSKQGKYDDAVKAYDEAIRLAPNNAGTWYNKGVALGKQGKYDEAIQAYEEAIWINPQDADAWFSKGNALDNQSKHDEAIQAYDEAVKINPQDAKAWWNKGAILMELGRFNEALQAYDEVIQINSSNIEAWVNECVWASKDDAFAFLGNYTEAIQAYDEAIKINSSNADAWFSKGNALSRQGKYDYAIEAYDEAIRLDPNLADMALSDKGTALRNKGLLMAAMALPASGQVLDDNATYCIVRSTTADLSLETFNWTPNTFAGFYYDIDNNIGTEQITFRPNAVDASKTNATLSDREGARGVIYKTTGQNKNFEFKAWGSYEIIGVLGEPYFAAYNQERTQAMAAAGADGPPCLWNWSESQNRNLMTNEQISSILIDSDNKITIAPGSPLRLDEDYELAIKSINADGKVSVELSKNGSVVDSKVFQPSINNARMSDKTYYYKKDLGDTKEIVIIAVHFKDAFHVDTEIAVVDGIFQISDTPLSIKVDQQYGKLSIREADPIRFSIVMDNKDNRITLSKDKVTELLPNVFIRTADQYFAPDKPLRYYIFKKCNCPAVK